MDIMGCITTIDPRMSCAAVLEAVYTQLGTLFLFVLRSDEDHILQYPSHCVDPSVTVYAYGGPETLAAIWTG
jgi:hypothetical protein